MKTTVRSILAIATLGLGAVSLAPAKAADAKPYPLKTCLVSGNELGAMGKPVSKVYNGQEIKFCCKPCIKKFEANPDKFLSKLPK